MGRGPVAGDVKWRSQPQSKSAWTRPRALVTFTWQRKTHVQWQKKWSFVSMTQLYASMSNTKKAKSSKFDFLLDLEKAADFQRLFYFGLTGEVGACQSDDWLRINNLCLCSGVLSSFIWRGRLMCIFHKKGARKIGPLFYWYVPTLFAVAHEL